MSKTSEGVAVTIVDIRGVLSAGEKRELLHMRVREPRDLEALARLLPYPAPPRIGEPKALR